MNKFSYVLFISALIFAPLAFGTVENWSLLVLQLLVAAAVFTFCLQGWQSSDKLLHVPGLLPLFLLVVWMVLQVLPLPVAIVKILSPETYQVYKPVYDMLEGSPWMPLSVHVKGSVLETIRITTYIFFYVLTVQILSQGDRLRRTVLICSWLAIGIGLLAILQKFSSPNEIYWLRSVPANAQPVGPWINRSQYCGYVELVAPLVLALCLYYRPIVVAEESMRKRIAAFFAKDEGVNLYLLLGFGLLVLTASAFISLCRGGIIALTFSFIFFFLTLARKQRKYSSLFSVGLIACFVIVIAWFGWGPIFERFDQIFNSSGEVVVDRVPLWENSWGVFKDFWLTGSGFGTFIAIFPRYRTLPGDGIFDHAHNDYLELLTDGGIIGFVIVAWFVVVIFHQGWKMLQRRRDRYSILLSIGALTGIVGLLIHSISDFNMHNGAVGLYFFFLCGVLVSAGNTRFHYQMHSTLLNKSKWLSRNILLFTGGVFFCLVVFGQGGVTLARWHYSNVKNIYLSKQLSSPRLQEVSTALYRAAQFDPLEGLYPFLQGEVQRYLNSREKALHAYIDASLKDPLDGAFLQRVALMLPEERRQDAQLLLETGAKRTLKKNQHKLTHIEWLLSTKQRAKAIEVIRDTVAEKADLVTVIIPLLQSYSFSREELAAALPENVESRLKCAAFLEKIGNSEDAAYFLEHALDYIGNESRIRPEWFLQIFEYYRKQKDADKALEVLRLGIEKLPNYPRFHELLGDYYSKEGIVYRALEEYQQAQLLDPTNEVSS